MAKRRNRMSGKDIATIVVVSALTLLVTLSVMAGCHALFVDTARAIIQP